jgi:hypothetical protein
LREHSTTINKPAEKAEMDSTYSNCSTSLRGTISTVQVKIPGEKADVNFNHAQSHATVYRQKREQTKIYKCICAYIKGSYQQIVA